MDYTTPFWYHKHQWYLDSLATSSAWYGSKNMPAPPAAIPPPVCTGSGTAPADLPGFSVQVRRLCGICGQYVWAFYPGNGECVLSTHPYRPAPQPDKGEP